MGLLIVFVGFVLCYALAAGYYAETSSAVSVFQRHLTWGIGLGTVGALVFILGGGKFLDWWLSKKQ